MNVAKLRRMQTGDGQPRLVGVVNQDLPRGCMVMLKREGDDYHLIAVANDGRRICTDKRSLFSFIEPTPDELAAMRSDQRKP